MNNRKQTNHLHKSKLFIAVAVTALVAMVGTAAWIWYQEAQFTPTTQQNAHSIKFVYDNEKTPGWWTAGNRHPEPNAMDANTPEDVELPVADMSLHQCKVANKCSNFEHDTVGAHCFVSTSYMEGAIQPDKAISDMISQNEEWGVTVNQVATTPLTMNTPEGDKSYTLHQFDYIRSGGEKLKQGNAQGYIPLSTGYIDIRAVCDEAGQLNEATPALDAISLTSDL